MKNLVILILLIGLGVLGYTMFITDGTIEDVPEQLDELEEVLETTPDEIEEEKEYEDEEEVVKEEEQEEETERYFEIGSGGSSGDILVRDFEYVDNVEKSINDSQEKSGDDSESIYHKLIQDPTDTNIYYFSTVTTRTAGDNFIGIYRFEYDSQQWERLYKTTLTTPKENATPYMQLVGIDGNQLVLFTHTFETSGPGGLCTSMWLLDENMAMDLEDPYGGLLPYEPSNEILEEAEAWEEECRETI